MTDTKLGYGWLTILLVMFFITLCCFLILNDRIHSLEHPVTPAEVSTFIVEQSLISEGWTEECVSSINVSKHKYVDESRDYGCGDTNIIFICDSSDKYCDYYCNDGKIIDLSNFTIVPAHVVYYNESICTKYTLVKYGIEESMSWN